MTSQLNVDLIRKLRGSLMCLAYFVDMLSVGVCSTKHWQTADRLVQELNVCTVLMTRCFSPLPESNLPQACEGVASDLGITFSLH